ncbi:major CP [Chimpanzee faeces associated microphage 3]|uniref:major CP n=1 Tax=Chimpanzee faeces associated microphage 3 TaxID=1676183 RepID=UPI0007FB6C2A|nr:major CP [Chimpanzee faeces associated microphage 3]AKO71500.1 major CP [Chimpanzee faeces associated microphage 3]
MNHVFSMIPKSSIKRSFFDRSSNHKTTLNSGVLVPVFCDEVLPSDTFKFDMSAFARLTTQVVPTMSNVYMDFQFFFVPYRLVWEHWNNFMGEQDNPSDSTDFLVPQITKELTTSLNGTIWDYFGLPTSGGSQKFSALPFRAYNLIWNDWYRDENLQASVEIPLGDTDDGTAYKLLPRGKRHDYFTSCLPWAQKNTDGWLPTLGIGGSAPVVGNGNPVNFYGVTEVDSNDYVKSLGNFNLVGYQSSSASTASNKIPVSVQNTTKSVMPSIGDRGVDVGNLSVSDSLNFGIGLASSDSNVFADLSKAGGITINDLRTAFQMQRLKERDARGGTRYTEILRAHFGVVSPDSRLQRPEYLGGGEIPLIVSSVPQTSSSDATTPQGNLAAYSVFSGRNTCRWTKSFVEHGVVIGLCSVRADLEYQQGLNRMWSRRTRYDFYWPALANLGEQAVLNKEIYADSTDGKDDEVFGYQERWSEYRYKPSMITGKLRSNDPQSLDVWHLAQNFIERPTLSSDFIKDAPPIKRVLAVQDEPEFVCDFHFICKCARPMPVYSVPGLIDHH